MIARKFLVIGLAIGLLLAVQLTGRWARAIQPTKNEGRNDKIGNGMTTVVIKGNNGFATDLYTRLKDKTSGNLFFSPYSISAALAMTYAGATGETQKQMAEVLHFTVPESELNQAMDRIRKSLLADKKKGYQLQVANRLWGQKGHEFLPEFLQMTRKFYGAELGVLDFAQDAESARQEINQWVGKQTEDKIKDLLPVNSVDATTRLVLTNAIYFKGNWQEKFNKNATKDAPFHVSADREITVPMMHQTKSFGYRVTEDLQVPRNTLRQGRTFDGCALAEGDRRIAAIGEESDSSEPSGVDQGVAAAEGVRLRAEVQDDFAVRPQGYAPSDGDDTGLRPEGRFLPDE